MVGMKYTWYREQLTKRIEELEKYIDKIKEEENKEDFLFLAEKLLELYEYYRWMLKYFR
ncbi:MAG: hypothetical protein QW472_05130 [Candidatus Aenigmatarchaeota archaeon]